MERNDPDEVRIALVEEQVSIARREVDTDHVRVRTVVDVHETVVDERRQVGRLDVTRIAVEREVAEAPEPYRIGDTLIIPIVEERLVVAKRLFVIEEVHVTSSSTSEAVSIPVTVRRTRAVIERDDHDPFAPGDNA